MPPYVAEFQFRYNNRFNDDIFRDGDSGMLKRWHIVSVGFLILYIVWFHWWASSGYLLEGPICETYDPPKNCDSHNVFFYSAWLFGKALDHWSTLITAFATAIIGVFTFTLWGSTRDQLIHNRRVERAYVKLSHRSPGLTVHHKTELFEVTNVVKNFGQTPAQITDVVICPLVLPHGERLPERPTYRRRDGGHPPQSFLVADEEFSYLRFYNLEPGQMNEVLDLAFVLYVIGYVDYIDRFGDRHRAGYGRQYAPLIDDRAIYKTDREYESRSNLVFITDAGYNYDRPPGEGNDWGEN
jgi:hypothetical protein